ncbi:MAG: ATP-dependent DNA helicase [Lachnospiraceae bacterium]|nr:ATP-dependent DNA helicase [Lachnospiraceae bacterium]
MEVHISVRQLVEFILREGSIDKRKSAGVSNAMQEGSRIHRMIQGRMGADYHSEVVLKYVWSAGEYGIAVEGRADGIIDADFAQRDSGSQPRTGNKVIIDEIKGVYRELKRIAAPEGVHLAQAKCYAYIYAEKNSLDTIGVRVTYCNMETEEIKSFEEEYTFDALRDWFDGLLTEYKKWTDFQAGWDKIRTASIKELAFPFPYREGQRELAEYVYRTIYHKRKLFLQAPTGVGKTISTVFPAVKAMGEGLAERIFYLTAKTITRTVAQDCFELLRQRGLSIKTVTLTARDKICFLKEDGGEAECNPDACPYADGHYDRINGAIYELLTGSDSFTRDEVQECARRHMVCPFELNLDMSLFSDAVICDYNYVFDPRVALKRFFGENNAGRDYVFLVDEAHNLLERGRDIYSAALLKSSFLKIKRMVKEMSPKLARLLDKCNRELLAMKRQCDRYRREEGIDGFVNALMRVYEAMDDFLEEHESFPERNEILEFYFEASYFLDIYEILDENYVVYSQLTDDGDFMLKLFCVDPSENLKSCMRKGRSSILFSATFLPIMYYKRLLGGEPQDYEVYARSTFSEDKKALFIANDVTSKYTRRSEEEFGRIARYIYEVVRQRHGNYMVFLPSHLFLEQVYNRFMEEYSGAEDMECIAQEDYMSEAKREEFLQRFRSNEDGKNLIGFCVMGGIFSEGIDLKRDDLIGALIVGTGIPQTCCERELLRQYFDGRGENGFDYAYCYPGMNKVLQSAGRVIRTAEDVGVVALLDERFLEYRYRRMFPREWSRYEVVGVDEISARVEKFWNDWL